MGSESNMLQNRNFVFCVFYSLIFIHDLRSLFLFFFFLHLFFRFSKQKQSCDLGRAGQGEKKIAYAEPVFNKPSWSWYCTLEAGSEQGLPGSRRAAAHRRPAEGSVAACSCTFIRLLHNSRLRVWQSDSSCLTPP